MGRCVSWKEVEPSGKEAQAASFTLPQGRSTALCKVPSQTYLLSCQVVPAIPMVASRYSGQTARSLAEVPPGLPSAPLVRGYPLARPVVPMAQALAKRMEAGGAASCVRPHLQS